MKKKHGMTGLRNAAKHDDEKKLACIQMRCDRKIKDGAEKTAKEDGKTLSKWLTELIVKNSKY